MPIMHQVESTNLDSIGWENDILTVRFRSGASYQYFDVPENVFISIRVGAIGNSIGKTFNMLVRNGLFEYRLI